MNIANNQKSFRCKQDIIVWQQHCKDSSSQSVRLGFVDKIFGKKQFFLFPTKFVRMSRRIKKGEHRQWLLKLQMRTSSCVTTIATTRNHMFSNFKEWFIHDRECLIYDKIWYVHSAIFLLLEVRLISTSISLIEPLFCFFFYHSHISPKIQTPYSAIAN